MELADIKQETRCQIGKFYTSKDSFTMFPQCNNWVEEPNGRNAVSYGKQTVHFCNQHIVDGRQRMFETYVIRIATNVCGKIYADWNQYISKWLRK